MDAGLSKDLIKSVVDKLFIGLVVFTAGWFWANVVEADRTFWKAETERLKSDGEMLIKLLDREKSAGEGLRSSAALAIAGNGLNEAIILFCNNGPRLRSDPFADWCDEGRRETARRVPNDGDFLRRYAISPGRRALYESIVQGAKTVAATQEAAPPLAAAVDGNFRNSAARRAVSSALASTADGANQTAATLASVVESNSYPVASSVQDLSRALPTRVYVQINQSLSRTEERELRKLLSEASTGELGYLFPPVERISNEKMPRQTQIRYFSDGDATAAKAFQAWLQKRGIEASTLRIRLTAPPNQIELWYMKSG